METVKLNVFIYKDPQAKNPSAHIEEVKGLVIAKKSVHEIQKTIKDSLEFHALGFQDSDISEPWLENKNWEFIYHYDIGALLDLYQGIFNQSNFARVAGISDSLMRQYLCGIKKPAKKQLSRIQNNLRTFAADLLNVRIL
jgi:hypothetical protein